MNKIELLRELYKNHVEGEDWISSVPNEVSPAFFDNPYIHSMEKRNELLSSLIFTEAELGWVHWFMYDWHNSKDLTVFKCDIEFNFDDIEDFLKYLCLYENWVRDVTISKGATK